MARLAHGSGKLLAFWNGTVFIICVGFGGIGFADQYVCSPIFKIEKKTQTNVRDLYISISMFV